MLATRSADKELDDGNKPYGSHTVSESWWHSGIMSCLRSDVDRDKPVAYIFWLIEGANGPIVVDTGYHPDYVALE